ncbi:MAG: ROK family protein [Lachnospiraceae bacterium]|jgi:glucokinase|nr:ROK family protein [Lachnospiraceae bacterium]
MRVVTGIDIGGTKCAISFACLDEEKIKFLDKVRMDTEREDFARAVKEFIRVIRLKLNENPKWRLCSIGISCGGPLDAQEGLILSPPNLPKWERADIFTPLKRAFGVPVMIQNDADACALAEWRMGAGKGCQNMIFLTFGTGMGAGLILNGRLYSGTNNLAGEVGHIRLAEEGPVGYGKGGSFEGFCSGGGIADLGRKRAGEALDAGKPPLFCPGREDLPRISAKSIAEAMEQGDALAAEIFDTVGEYLGRGVSLLVDILNPERIIIGSIYARQREALEKRMLEVVEAEALRASTRVCRILPASLGEQIGDYAAVSVGIKAYEELYSDGMKEMRVI